MPRLLLITYYFPPWGMGGVQRVAKFAKYLPEFGWDITVLTVDPGKYHQDDPSLLADIPSSVRVERIAYRELGSRAAQAQGMTRSLSRFAGRLISWPDRHRGFERLAFRRAVELHRENSFDAVMTSSPPPSIHLAGLQLGQTIPWVADFRDPWQARFGDFGPTPLHAWYNRALYARLVRRADAVVAVTPELATVLSRVRGNSDVVAIPNGYDESDFSGVATTGRAPNELLIVCPGTFSEFSDPRPILRAIASWRKSENRRVRVVHVGHALGVEVARAAQDCGIGDIFEQTGYIPHRDAISWLLRADLIAISYADTPALAVSVPGRIYEALRSLKPIVAFTAPDGALAHLLSDIPACWVVPTQDTDAGTRAIHEALTSGVIRLLESVQSFSRRKQAQQLAEILDSATQGRQGRGR
jgi:hypothetical protein